MDSVKSHAALLKHNLKSENEAFVISTVVDHQNDDRLLFQVSLNSLTQSSNQFMHINHIMAILADCSLDNSVTSKIRQNGCDWEEFSSDASPNKSLHCDC